MSNRSHISEEFDIELWSQFIGGALSEERPWVQTIYIVSLIILFIIAVAGNLLSCIVIYCDKTMHTATNYYLLNLAASDLVVSFALPLEIHEHVSEHQYQYGPVGCKLHFILVVMLWNNSILTMTVIAIERYIGIWHPMALQSKPAWRRVLKIIALIWMLAIAASAPEYFTVRLVKTRKSAVCFTVPTNYARVLNGILALITFVVPLILMTILYVMIAAKVSKTERSTKRDKIFNHRDNTSKVNKLIALTLSFVVCWLPFFSMRIIFFACSVKQLMNLKEWFTLIYKVVIFNSWFGMVLNPVLFSLKSTKFRKALKALWNAKFKRKPSRHTQKQAIILQNIQSLNSNRARASKN